MKGKELRSDQISYANVDFLEQMYEAFKRDPGSCPLSWQGFLKQFDTLASQIDPLQAPSSPQHGALAVSRVGDTRIANLIEAYRTYGHLMAKVNPIAIHPQEEPWQLQLST